MQAYWGYVCNSYIAEIYDIKDKKYFDCSYTYYFTDCRLRNTRLNFRQMEYSHLMENVIYYNKLKIPGFSVDVVMVTIQHTGSEGIQHPD